ncbi:MAG TPA: CHRD domain-containing protein [Kiloniellales bacterium]
MKLRQALLALVASSGLILTASAASAANQAFAILAGGFETQAADNDGFGSATILFVTNRKICYAVLVEKIANPTAMHIHEAPPGVNGPVRVNLTPPKTGDPGRVAGCVGNLDAALVRDIRENPTSYYINIHNDDFPLGAVRGQLF